MTPDELNAAIRPALNSLDGPIVGIYTPNPEEWQLGGRICLCICDAPGFQQPCETCGYYPYGNDPREDARCSGRANRGSFVAAVNRAGNIGAFWLRSKTQTVAYRDNPAFAAAVQDAVAKAKTMQWPSAEECWDAFESERNVQRADRARDAQTRARAEAERQERLRMITD